MPEAQGVFEEQSVCVCVTAFFSCSSAPACVFENFREEKRR